MQSENWFDFTCRCPYLSRDYERKLLDYRIILCDFQIVLDFGIAEEGDSMKIFNYRIFAVWCTVICHWYFKDAKFLTLRLSCVLVFISIRVWIFFFFYVQDVVDFFLSNYQTITWMKYLLSVHWDNRAT